MTPQAGSPAAPSRRNHRPPRPTFALPSTLTTLLLTLAVLLTSLPTRTSAQSERHRDRRDFRALSDAQVGAIAQLAPPEWDSVDGGHLEHLLVERVSGTDGNTRVQEYISSVFKGLGWHEDKYATTMDTPLGELPFTNLVYTFDPDAPRRLVLSAHFDSKWFPDGGFIGATDSAAPCAFMLDVAESLTPLLKSRAARLAAGTPLLTAHLDELEAGETTLQLVFFDGEEAFHQWTRADSVYGSRHLAATWEDTLLPPHHPLARRRMAPTPNMLDTIDVLVLLDLLGAPGPRIQSYYRETDWLFEEMRSADTRLRAAGLVEGKEAGWFVDFRGYAGMIDDDHRPFLEKGVPVLHVIPNPFPHVWHKQFEDDAKALDLPTLRRWVRILRVFTAGYLGLAPDDNGAGTSRTNGTATAAGKSERDELVRG